MSFLVLFQREISPQNNYMASRTLTIFPLSESALEAALAKVRFGYRPYAVSFKELPPEHLLMQACEEAVREKRARALPLANAPTKVDLTMFRKKGIK